MDLHLSMVQGSIGGQDLDPDDDLDHGDAEIAIGTASAWPEESVLTAAILVATAFRMRDEHGLGRALRLLVGAVASWEGAQGDGCAGRRS